MTISFIGVTAAFCVLLHYLLFFTDHHGKKILVAFLLTGLILTCIVLIWLFNKILKATFQNGSQESKSM